MLHPGFKRRLNVRFYLCLIIGQLPIQPLLQQRIGSIAVGDMATYAIETNKARPATREEVMKILQRAEDNGFVHQVTNIDGEDKILGICNCCVCSCYALRTSQLFNTPNMSASTYRAHVDPEKCVACGQCAEVCPAGAAKLGQKLCTKDGPIVYPKQVLPDETKWGPEMWNENYRDDNPSANCYDTGTAPCKSNCPAHIAVQSYIRMAAEGRYMDALKLIKKENPFPTVCGHICNRRCDHPEATKMIRSEDKMKAILPYIIKRAAKIKVKELRNKHS